MSARGAKVVDDWFEAGQLVIVAAIPEPLVVPVPVDGLRLLMVLVPDTVPVRYRPDVAASAVLGYLRDQHPEETWKAMVRAAVALDPDAPALRAVREALLAVAPPPGAAQDHLLGVYDEFHASREAARRASRWSPGLVAADGADGGDGDAGPDPP